MKFKKILATVGSVLMLSSVIGGAFAAGLPTTLKADNTVIVQGTGSNDANAISTLQTELAKSATQGAVSVSGESVNLNTVSSKSVLLNQDLSVAQKTLYQTDLPSLLASSRIRSGSTNIDYEQSLTIGNHQVKFGTLGHEDNYVVNENLAKTERPVLHIDQKSGAAWDLTVDFLSDLDVTKVRSGEILTIAGKQYSFDLNQDPTKDLVLFASAQTEIVTLGSSKDLVIDGKTITVEVTGANTDSTPSTATILVNGVMEEVEANHYVYSGDTKLYINRVFTQNIPEPTASVEIFVGTEELKIDKGTSLGPVEINDEIVDGVEAVAYTTTNLAKLDKIMFRFTPKDTESPERAENDYLELGESITDPVLGTINMVFGSASQDLKENKALIELNQYREEMQVTFTNRNGNTYTFSPYNLDATWEKVQHKIPTDFKKLTRLDNKGDIIIFEDDEISRVMSINSVSLTGSESDHKVVFKDESTGSTTEVRIGREIQRTDGWYLCYGGEFNSSNDGKWVCDTNAFSIQNDECMLDGDTNTSRIATANTVLYAANDIKIDLSNLDKVEIIEEENSNNVLTFNIANNTEDKAITVGIGPANRFGSQDADKDFGYYMTTYGSYIETEDEDNKWAKVWSPEEEVSYNVFIASEVSSIGEAGDLIVADTETAKMSGKNLIVVGGSAINSVAARLLGFDGPAYGEDFTEKTGVSAGEYLIQSFDKDDGKVAIVVAGYNAADTENGAKYLALKDYVVGKKYKGTTADVAQEVTA